MQPIPTLHLRFVKKYEIDRGLSQPGASVARAVKVLQQFWQHQDGKECCGDILNLQRGTWRDIPLVEGEG